MLLCNILIGGLMPVINSKESKTDQIAEEISRELEKAGDIVNRKRIKMIIRKLFENKIDASN